MENRNMDVVERGLQEFMDNTLLHPTVRKRAKYLLDNLHAGIAAYENELEELSMMAARYPSFDQDMVGWLADDFG